MALTDRLRKTILEHALTASGDLVLVAVSGGADSLALLHALHQLQRPLGIRLHVATLDHGLRGEAGAADADHVVSLGDGWNIPVTRDRVDVPSLARTWGVGIETAARRARYDFLARTANTVGAAAIATAHHAGDQAETVLLHLVRGAGIHGLGGMQYASPVPGHPDLRLIRPMLAIPRRLIEQYCADNAIAFRQDATNDDITYTRNRVRHELLPMLKHFNPAIEAALVTLADNARHDDALLDFLLQQARDRVVAEHTDNRIVLNSAAFRALQPALQRRMLLWAAQMLGAETVRAEQIARTQSVTIHDKRGAVSQFSDNVHLRVDYETLVIARGDAESADRRICLLPTSDYQLALTEGSHVLDGWTLHVHRHPAQDTDKLCWVRLAVPQGAALSLRGRSVGDRFSPAGMGGHTQKLSDWMINRKVPQSVRDRVPLIVIDDRIAAVLWGHSPQINEEFMVHQDSLDSVCIWSEKHKE